MAKWNPWHGCIKHSAGCQNCYVYRIDAYHGRDASAVFKTQGFYDIVKKKRDGSWKIPSGEMVWTCFSSDFLLDKADGWRDEAWAMMRERQDLGFFFITKRIERLERCLPPDWGEGYPNVSICCTVENQDRADFRLPIYIEAPIRHKSLACEPLLGPLNISRYLSPRIGEIVAGGESGTQGRPCDYAWILSLREQCAQAGVAFHFKQTGTHFIKDGRLHTVPRKLQHSQARKAGINIGGKPIYLRGGIDL